MRQPGRRGGCVRPQHPSQRVPAGDGRGWCGRGRGPAGYRARVGSRGVGSWQGHSQRAHADEHDQGVGGCGRRRRGGANVSVGVGG